MMSTSNNAPWMVCMSTLLHWTFLLTGSTSAVTNIHVSSACYGVFNNFLNLQCPQSQVISNVTRVGYGAKAKSQGCPYVTNNDNYKDGCCDPEHGDCIIPMKNANFYVHCMGKQKCELQTVWVPLIHCNPDNYPGYTNFMTVQYQCSAAEHNFSPTTRRTTTTTTAPTTTTMTTTAKIRTMRISSPPEVPLTSAKHNTDKQTGRISSISPTTRTTTTTTIPTMRISSPPVVPLTSAKYTTDKQTGRISSRQNSKTTPGLTTITVVYIRSKTSLTSEQSENKRPILMIGVIIAITCGAIGMLLSVLCLWIYCRRKSQTVPDPNVFKIPSSRFWNNILPQSLTPKSFGKGYDNFSNLMPSTNSVLTYRDGQHAHILRSSSDASNHSNQSNESTSSACNQANTPSPSNTPTTFQTSSGAPFAVTILNNLNNG